MRTSTYHARIAARLATLRRTDVDPRHVEGYMRLEHPTLDGLAAGTFDLEVDISVACVDADGVRNAEANARSFGL